MTDLNLPVPNKTLNCLPRLESPLLMVMTSSPNREVVGGKPARILNLQARLNEANLNRSELASLAFKPRQGRKHVSLAIRYKAYLSREEFAVGPQSLQDFLEDEDSIRNWGPGSRSTTWGAAVGMARRGQVYGLSISFDPLLNQLFRDARKAVQTIATQHAPEKPETLDEEAISNVIHRLQFREMKTATVIATCVGARIGDVLQLEKDQLEALPRIAEDAMSFTFLKGKVVQSIGPYTVGTSMGSHMPYMIEIMKSPAPLFKKRTELEREKFEAQLVAHLRRINPSLGLRTFRNSFARTLGHAECTNEEITQFLRHSTMQMTMKYLRNGKDYMFGLRQGYNTMAKARAMNIVQQRGDESDDSETSSRATLRLDTFLPNFNNVTRQLEPGAKSRGGMSCLPSRRSGAFTVNR